MAHARSGRPVRWFPALGIGTLLAAVLAGVALTRGPEAGRHGAAEAAPAPPLQARELRFADLADGGVSVTDARDGAAVALIAPGEGGFLRGTVRGLVRDRRRSEAAPGPAAAAAA